LHDFSMPARTATADLRSRCRSWIGSFAAAWYLVVAIGLPLATPGGGGKDLSRPFLCMHRNCGCMNAEQCYRSCCCHTAAERLAFARRQGDVPPPELVAAAEREACAVVAQPPKCCGESCASKSAAAEPSPVVEAGYHVVVLQESLACRGAAEFWLMAGAAVTPLIVEHELYLGYGDRYVVHSETAESLISEPETPPPQAS
jgi:hypothetical protein